jgi:hypothetical protein
MPPSVESACASDDYLTEPIDATRSRFEPQLTPRQMLRLGAVGLALPLSSLRITCVTSTFAPLERHVRKRRATRGSPDRNTTRTYQPAATASVAAARAALPPTVNDEVDDRDHSGSAPFTFRSEGTLLARSGVRSPVTMTSSSEHRDCVAHGCRALQRLTRSMTTGTGRHIVLPTGECACASCSRSSRSASRAFFALDVHLDTDASYPAGVGTVH